MPVAHHVIPATTAPVASTASVKSSQMKNLPVYFVKESKSIRTFKDSIMSRLLYEFDLADQRNDVVTEGFINKQAWRYARFFGKGTLPRDCTSMIDKLVEKAFAIDNNNKKCEATLEAQILKDMTPVTAPEFDASKQHEFDNTFYHRPPSIVVSDGGYSLPPPIECKDTLNLANNDTYYVQSEVPEAPTRTALKVYLYGSAYQLINQPIWARSKLK
jgi:hypothetical protein